MISDELVFPWQNSQLQETKFFGIGFISSRGAAFVPALTPGSVTD
jgi:hypothetical protein